MIDGRMSDCAKMILGVSSYMNNPNADRSIAGKAFTTLKPYTSDVDKMLIAIGEEADKAPSSGGKVSFHMARYESVKAWDSKKVEAAGEVISRFLYQVKRNAGLLSSLDGRAKEGVRGLSSLSEGYSYADVFAVPNASKITRFRKWHDEALASLAVGVVEEARADMLLDKSETEGVVDLATQLKELDRDIRVNGIDPRKEALRQRLEEELFLTADASEDRKGALKAAAGVLFSNGSYASETGKKISEEFGGLTEEQERAMVAEGKVLIAAGAGSGKTKVLAGKVVYHAIEQGVPLNKIIAVAFNRKASAELRERIIRYGGPQMEGIHGMSNFKTTHSFSISVIGDALRVTKGRRKNLLVEDKDIEGFLEQAILQVSVGSQGIGLENQVEQTGDIGFEPRGFFDTSKSSSVSREEAQIQAFVKDAISRMIYMTILFGKQTDQRSRDRLTKMIRADEKVFSSLARWSWDESAPTEVKPLDQWTKADKDALNAYIENRAGGSSTNRASKALETSGLGSKYRFANERPALQVRPVGQWFNLGVSPLAEQVFNEAGELTGLRANMKHEILEDIESYIGDQLSNCISPEEALRDAVKEAQTKKTSKDENGNEKVVSIPFTYTHPLVVRAAVYGAFQYLKTARNMMTFDDSLVLASKALIENPSLLAQYREKYSHILVDEAQDLNKAQHLLFGLIAGHINPKTEEPYDDDQSSSKVFAFIGDDKQAIYEFRGAQPEEFISKSDLRGGSFKTMILNTNFRSGRRILEAANNLIQYNTDQIPMVCNANPANDDGSISYTIGDIKSGEAQMRAAGEIADIISAEGFEKDAYRAGVICRTNKELIPFALGLVSKGIPYYSKKPLLSVPSMDAMLNMANVKSARKDLNLSGMLGLTEKADKIFDLGYKLDAKFRSRLSELITRNEPSSPVDWYIQKGWSQIYTDNQSWRNDKDCKAFADFLFLIRSFSGTPYDFMKAIIDGLFAPLKAQEEESSTDEDKKDDTEDTFIIGSVLLNIFERYDNVEEAIDFCKEIKTISKESSSKSQSERRDVVFLGTAHGWKGLEADNMWVVMDADTFPHPKALEEEGGMAEERRLAYVALTRGKKGVNIITTEAITDDKGKTKGGPSPFIFEACVKSAPGAPGFPEENVTDVDVDEEMESVFKMASKIRDLSFNAYGSDLLF